jgi:type II secretory pathway component PulK
VNELKNKNPHPILRKLPEDKERRKEVMPRTDRVLRIVLRAGGARRHRGVIFVTALGIVVILAGLVLVFAQAMRSESLASANRLSAAQADAVELGAEQWVLAQCDAYTKDAQEITQVPAEALQVGGGYFWILQPDPDSDSTYQFGIVDEGSKMDINFAGLYQLEALSTSVAPNFTPEMAASIVAWRGGAGSASAVASGGADTSYYQSLPEPYDLKGPPGFETVEELLLVQDITPRIMWGYDMNRNGVLEDAERNAGGVSNYTGAGSGADNRGIYNYLTCYNGTQGININTASDTVMMAVLGLTQAQAEEIVTERAGQDNTTSTWVTSIIGQATYTQLKNLKLIVGSSQKYSADIVAVSGDGRSFKRVRIVVDDSVTPAKIIYRKDLTSYGWPLTDDIRQQLRAGQRLQAGGTMGAQTNTSNIH